MDNLPILDFILNIRKLEENQLDIVLQLLRLYANDPDAISQAINKHGSIGGIDEEIDELSDQLMQMDPSLIDVVDSCRKTNAGIRLYSVANSIISELRA
jgi:hypothetical protein